VWVAVAVAAAFEDFDLVGDAFGVGVGLGVIEVVEDGFSPPLQAGPDADELGYSGVVDVVNPEVEPSFGLFATIPSGWGLKSSVSGIDDLFNGVSHVEEGKDTARARFQILKLPGECANNASSI
jgi:hypothetical protein